MNNFSLNHNATISILAALTLPLLSKAEATMGQGNSTPTRDKNVPAELTRNQVQDLSVIKLPASPWLTPANIDVSVNANPNSASEMPATTDEDKSRKGSFIGVEKRKILSLLKEISVEVAKNVGGIVIGALGTAALAMWSRYQWLRRNFGNTVTAYYLVDARMPFSKTFLEAKIGHLFSDSPASPQFARKFADEATPENPFVGFPKELHCGVCKKIKELLRRNDSSQNSVHDQMFAEIANTASAALSKEVYGQDIFKGDAIIVALTNERIERKKLRVPLLAAHVALDRLENLKEACANYLDNPRASESAQFRFVTDLKLAVLAWCKDPTFFEDADRDYRGKSAVDRRSRDWSAIAQNAEKLRTLFLFNNTESIEWLKENVLADNAYAEVELEEMDIADAMSPLEITNVDPELEYFEIIRMSAPGASKHRKSRRSGKESSPSASAGNNGEQLIFEV